ncbi:MAG: hypothetical protein KJ927_06225 [Candidatus Eisenbacteria bacterium]|nr:hypothetical protein [Candidatus Eisenbacteria bacterium]MBU1948288.1 hypothetical protein [Candidatus Eisenbacteria bacterium]
MNSLQIFSGLTSKGFWPLRAFGILLAAAVLCGCHDNVIESRWRNEDLVIDGDLSEWQGKTTYIESEKVYLGILNDQDFLYIGLSSTNPMRNLQVLMQGMTLRIDPKAKDSEPLGIRFPLGAMDMGFIPDENRQRPDITALQRFYSKSEAELEILAGDNPPLRMALLEAAGIDAVLGGDGRQLTYEMKIPLHPNEIFPFALQTHAGALIGLKIETPEIDQDTMRRQMQERGGPEGGGRPGDGMGGGGRGGNGGGRGGMRGTSEHLKISAAVRLANPFSTEVF